MRIIVQKFGGTSLSTAEARERAIHHIKSAVDDRFQVVVVVSAMGRLGEPYATDSLIEWIGKNGNNISDMERDMLLCCGETISAVTLSSLLNQAGVQSVALNGAQAGILTDNHFGSAHIEGIDTKRIMDLLKLGRVVIVTGFQGKTQNDDFTTLGRGGSDTSATALGAALGAEMVDIFTDVSGILTADPRIVENAKPLSRVSYLEICHMAYNGAKVIHPRAVEIAMQANLPVRVRSTFSDEQGTLVTNLDMHGHQASVQDKFITGIAHVRGVTQIQVAAGLDCYDLQLQVFQAMAKNQISVDFINVNPSGVVYTVYDSEAEKAAALIRGLGFDPLLRKDCAKVSVIGGGMNGVPGIMAHIVEALTAVDVQILQSADSNTTIWVLVKGPDMVKAVRALHSKFELHKL